MSETEKLEYFKNILANSYEEAYSNKNLTVNDLIKSITEKLKKII